MYHGFHKNTVFIIDNNKSDTILELANLQMEITYNWLISQVF